MLATTGARFVQLRRMRVADVQAEHRWVMAPVSYMGRKQAAACILVQAGAKTLAILALAIADRPRPRHGSSAGVQVKTADRRNACRVWGRGGRGPWSMASEMSRLWFQASPMPVSRPQPIHMRSGARRSAGLAHGIADPAGRGDPRHLGRDDRAALFALDHPRPRRTDGPRPTVHLIADA